ncbi:MAG: FtsX-like permease family protein, partial [Candidatus Thorarchaeota archaeon]
MAATPVGYEAFHNTRRKAVTLLCFLLASTMAMGISVYVDSYSVHEWDTRTDVGDVALRVQGSGLSGYLDDIRDIPGVTRAALLPTDYSEISRDANLTSGAEAFTFWGAVISPDETFRATFPDYVILESGRYPDNDDEIAVISSLHVNLNVDIGDTLNITRRGVDVPVQVVGIYSHGSGESLSPYYWDLETLAVVHPSFIDSRYSYDSILVDIDRTPITPFNPIGSAQYANSFDESIQRLDPFYDPPLVGSELHVTNYLTWAISSYIFWTQGVRISELIRSMAVFLLTAMVIFLAIRYNTNQRRYERGVLLSRGASMEDLESAVTREVVLLSVVSSIVGFGLGILFSRIALASTDYFVFEWDRLFTEPFLISIESFVTASVVGVILPFMTLGVYRSVYSTRKTIDENQGKLAKLARGLVIIRWDVLIVLLSALLLVSLSSGGGVVTANPFMSLLLTPLPLALFLGVSSLSIKILKTGAHRISRGMKRIVGEVPASVGVRRISKASSSAGVVSMVLVLSICLSWNSAIVNASLSTTRMNQDR